MPEREDALQILVLALPISSLDLPKWGRDLCVSASDSAQDAEKYIFLSSIWANQGWK